MPQSRVCFHGVHDIPWKKDQDTIPRGFFWVIFGFFLEPPCPRRVPTEAVAGRDLSRLSLPSPSSPSLLSPCVFLANSLAFEIQMLPWPFPHPRQEYLPFHLEIINK